MKQVFIFLLLIVTIAPASNAISDESPSDSFEEALDLIHGFSGSGDELQRAMKIAQELYISHPTTGYAETLGAEMLSTWELGQNGEPEELRTKIIGLTDEALRLNPELAQAYVARGRTFLRASQYEDATQDIDEALRLDSNLSGALFLRAEIMRRTGRFSEAETWYLKFIDSTPSMRRQSNGYYWLGKTYEGAASIQPADRASFLGKAREAYERMLELNPDGAWKNVNFAIFLNGEIGDFDAAEKYATKALSIMEFPMARYHLAIARYQNLLKSTDQGFLRDSTSEILRTTKISLSGAIKFSSPWPVIQARLQELQNRLYG